MIIGPQTFVNYVRLQMVKTQEAFKIVEET